MTGGCISGNARYADGFSLPKACATNYAMTNAGKHWRNIINKAKKNPSLPADRLEKMQAAFEAFKKEALQRKKAIKAEKASPKNFTDWLYQQSSILTDLLEES